MRKRIAYVVAITATFLALTVQPAMAILRPGH